MVNDRKGRKQPRSMKWFYAHLLLVALQFLLLSVSCWRIEQGDALLLFPSSFLSFLTAVTSWGGGSELSFDLEIGYSYDATNRTKELRMILSALQAATAVEHKRAARSPDLNDWKFVGERHRAGFELESPFNPSMESVARAVDVMKDHHITSNSLSDVIKVCFYVRGKGLSQLRNVFKNWVAAEEAFDQVRPVTHRGNRFRKSASMVGEFASVQDAFDKLNSCTSIACLYETAQPNQGLPLHAPRWYLMGLRHDKATTWKLQQQGVVVNDILPLKLEFRGQQSSVDQQFVVAWIRLLRAFVQASFDGIVLDAERGSVDESWSDIFDTLIRDEELHEYFNQRRALLAPSASEYLALEQSMQGEGSIENSGIRYGMEIEYLFPKIARTDDELHRVKWLNTMGESLAQVGVPNDVFTRKKGSKIVSKDSWKVVTEREGFELVSPLSPPLATVVKVIDVMRDMDPLISDITNVVHVSVDANNRTLEEVRRVITNYIVVERALDEIRTPIYRGGGHRKCASIVSEFSSIPEAFEQINACNSTGCVIRSALKHDRVWPKSIRPFYGLTVRRHEDDFPNRFEFRGQKSSIDSHFVAAWIKLTHSFIRQSYAGMQLDGRERTVEESWSALFDDLIQDDDLKNFFNRYRTTLNESIRAAAAAAVAGF